MFISYRHIVIVIVAILGGLIYFDGKNAPPLPEMNRHGGHEFSANIRRLTDLVVQPFCDTVNIRREIIDFQKVCLACKDTEMQWVAGYSYKYCDTLLEICRRRDDLYDSYSKTMARPPRANISTSLGKQSTQTVENRYSTGALEQWDTYVKNKQPLLNGQFKQILNAEEAYISSQAQTSKTDQ